MVLLVGFQAAGTRGRSLLDGARQLRMHGRTVPVRAEVVAVDGFSVHADADGLLAWLDSAPEPRRVYVVHGEPSASQALADRIASELGWRAAVAGDGQVVDLHDVPSAA
jgi:metallo-beta-lactamase family protein